MNEENAADKKGVQPSNTSPQVQALGMMLSDIYDSMDNLEAYYRYILAQPDRRQVPDQLRESLDMSMNVFQARLQARTANMTRDFERFRDVLLVLELEEATGRQDKWRALAKEAKEKNYRVSVTAITALREAHGIGIKEAKNVVEAYMDGLFE